MAKNILIVSFVLLLLIMLYLYHQEINVIKEGKGLMQLRAYGHRDEQYMRPFTYSPILYKRPTIPQLSFDPSRVVHRKPPKAV